MALPGNPIHWVYLCFTSEIVLRKRWRSLGKFSHTTFMSTSVWHHTGLSSCCQTHGSPISWLFEAQELDYLCYVLLWSGWQPSVNKVHMTSALLLIKCELTIVGPPHLSFSSLQGFNGTQDCIYSPPSSNPTAARSSLPPIYSFGFILGLTSLVILLDWG